MKVAYLVHDLNDAAVRKRVIMLRAAGAEVVVIGFRRTESAPETVGAAPTVDLGRTHDGRLDQRALAVAGALVNGRVWGDAIVGADVVMARNLEMLILAAAARNGRAPGARLIYECLDIHRVMLREDVVGQALRFIERRALAACELVVTSSPAFLEAYFAPRQGRRDGCLLVENKVLELSPQPQAVPGPDAGPPWRIGWFGVIRCQKSLDLLESLVLALPKEVEVVIRGRPALDQFRDFHGQVRATPGLRFEGAYQPEDLADLYGECHFAWAIDYFEEGQNSSWLLPNRLYESGRFGVVPIALTEVETGAWLARHGAGVLLDDPADSLAPFVRGLSQTGYADLRRRSAAIPLGDLRFDLDDCRDLLARLAGRSAEAVV